MKKLFLTILLVFVFLAPSVSQAALRFPWTVPDDPCADIQENYIQQVDRNVQLHADLEDCQEDLEIQRDKRADYVAVGVFTGILIGTGGVGVIVGAVGGLLGLIF